MSATIKDFKGWLQEICSFNSFEQVIEVVENSGKSQPGKYEARFKVRIYTGNNCYAINAVERGKEANSYLGCVASARKPRAGEDWTRGNDLPDGKLNRETWEEIKNAIIAYELVKLAKKSRGRVEKEKGICDHRSLLVGNPFQGCKPDATFVSKVCACGAIVALERQEDGTVKIA